MNVWLGWLGVVLELEEVYPDQLRFPKPGGRNLLTGISCLPQTSHIDFQHTRQGIPGFLLLSTEAEATSLWLCPGRHKSVQYSEKAGKKLAGVLKMVEAEIPAHWVLVGHSHLQMAFHLVAIASCLRRMLLRPLMLSVMGQNKTMPMAVVTVTLSITHWVLKIWYLRMSRLAIRFSDSVVLKVSFFSSASYRSVVILSKSRKRALECQSEL